MAQKRMLTIIIVDGRKMAECHRGIVLSRKQRLWMFEVYNFTSVAVHNHAMTRPSCMLSEELRKEKTHGCHFSKNSSLWTLPTTSYKIIWGRGFSKNCHKNAVDKDNKLQWIRSQGWHGTKIFFLCIIVKLIAKVLTADQLTRETEQFLPSWRNL